MVEPTQCPTAAASDWTSGAAWVDCEASPPQPLPSLPPLVVAWCDEPSAAVCVVGYEQLLEADDPPSPPPAPLSPPGCANTCEPKSWINDGYCDDGGPNSTDYSDYYGYYGDSGYYGCAYGTLCAGSNLHPNPLGLALSVRAQTACPSPSPCPDHRHRLCGLRPPAAAAAVAAPVPRGHVHVVLRTRVCDG